jgi:hypothetical protein
MKTIINVLIFISGLLILTIQSGMAQAPPFEVSRIHPYISVSKDQLAQASSLSDLKNEENHLNLEYQSDWVNEYILVEIQVCQKGEIKTAIGKSDIITLEQKKLLLNADTGREIKVFVNYIPKNNLKQNDPKALNFSFTVNPENAASFHGGEDALNKYFKTSAIDEISADQFEEYDVAAIKFVVNSTGEIHQTEIFGEEYQKGKFDSINQLLLKTIREMPSWNPASYDDGTKTDQTFVLTVGSKESCVLPLLRIGR